MSVQSANKHIELYNYVFNMLYAKAYDLLHCITQQSWVVTPCCMLIVYTVYMCALESIELVYEHDLQLSFFLFIINSH